MDKTFRATEEGCVVDENNAIVYEPIDDIPAHRIAAILNRHPDWDWEEVEDELIYLGVINPAPTCETPYEEDL